MKLVSIFLLYLFFSISISAQVTDGNYLLQLAKVSTSDLPLITTPITGSLVYNITDKAVYDYDGTSWNRLKPISTSWNTIGNTGTNAANSFLGTIDNIKMEIRSNNLPILQFGLRQTLGLTQNFPDYTNANQPLAYINGDGATSALQFSASGAAFYKPMFFTTSNGSFRLKGSAGVTDLFEIGSGGPSNDGKLEFTIGDDGAEPIIFKRYDYRLGRFHTELFRVQGSNNTQNAKTRFGININPQRVIIDEDYDDSSAGFNVANSTLQLNGSMSTSILRTTGNITLTEDHHTIIIGGNHNIRLPNANTCVGRAYVIKNPSTNDIIISTYKNESEDNDTRVDRRTSLWLQSDGTNWQKIN